MEREIHTVQIPLPSKPTFAYLCCVDVVALEITSPLGISYTTVVLNSVLVTFSPVPSVIVR